MPDDFQAQPPQWRPSTYDRYSEVNFRKPEKQATARPWAIIAATAAFLSVGLIVVLMVGMFLYPGSPPTFVASTAAIPVPPPTVVLLGDADVAALQGSWIATALTIDGTSGSQPCCPRTTCAPPLPRRPPWPLPARTRAGRTGPRRQTGLPRPVPDGVPDRPSRWS